jgi:ubiquinone biosynthesis monooxygenase Coq7
LRTLFAPAQTVRSYPDENVPDVTLSDEEKRHAAALMRINHVGEVCAQALYQGQALTARNLQTREALRQAAWEETEHADPAGHRGHDQKPGLRAGGLTG